VDVVRFGATAGLAAAAATLAMLAGGAPAYASSTVPPATSTTPSTSSTTSSTSVPAGTTIRTGPSSTTIRSGSGTETGQATATPGAVGEDALSPAELARQIAAAKSLTADLTKTNAGIAAATAKLDALAVEANTLLQQYSEARDAERTARAEANRNVELFHQLSARLGDDRRALGQWAYQAYAGGGGSLGDMSAFLDSLGRSAEEATDTAAQLGYLSDQRAHAFERVRDHTALQRDIAFKAIEASTAATEAAQQAADAKAKLDDTIAAQRLQLEATRKLHAEQVGKAGPISGLLLGSADENAIAAARELTKALLVAGIGKDGSVKPCSDNNAEYPNGQIPVSGLCPLVGDTAQMLRPAAAAAFNALSLAYQRETGSFICITDSYRSYPEQVAVKASRGKWAATPGTSEHGLGRALDLCGGINDFGSPAHQWMKQNAPLYGWFHPDWAEPGGSLPEPWHWEFAG
jgi:hypothetical protein